MTDLRLRYTWLLGGILMLGTACNNTKYLQKDQILYTGAEIKVEAEQMKKSERKSIVKQLQTLTRPKPNSSFLGLRPKLWFWNIGGEPKNKISVRRLIKNLGEPPVLLSDLDLEHNIQVLDSYLENKGYFRASVTGITEINGKKAQAVYTAEPGPGYSLNKIVFPEDSSVLENAIRDTREKSLLKEGRKFNLEVIKTERIRIDDQLKNEGFYYFSPEYLIMDVDTTIGDHQADIYVNSKIKTPDLAENIYRINDVIIYSNYSLNPSVADTSRQEAKKYAGYLVIDSAEFYKPSLFRQAMQFEPGDIYNRREHNATLQRLINLNVFKFVKNNFVRTSDTTLNAFYYLTPLPKKSLRAEIGGNTKSNNLTGVQLKVGFTNRNTFRGGEILNVDVTGGTEVQVSGIYKGYNTYRLGAEVNLAFPRFVVPFIYVNPRGGFVPRTNIQLGYDVLNRKNLYTLNSFRGAYGYLWKESIMKEHTFYPISIQYVQPVNVSQQYKDSLLSNPNLQKIIDTQFILGANYNYLFNQMAGPYTPVNGFYFNGLVDASGNVAGLVKRSVIKSGDTARLFGAPFSQYLKLETDFRYYRQLGNGSVWANRIILGSGFPYGNSRELPFIKQFFVGGNNSIRAFRSRALGPGTYFAGNIDGRGFIPDQSGDIKLEMNTELRFKIFNPVYGALFTDAGNIWLYNENPNKPGAKFSGDFMKELAIGSGLGLRVDITILVLRLDLAFPIRKPWLPESERWVFDQIDFGDKEWRQQNLIFNLAIGYPF